MLAAHSPIHEEGSRGKVMDPKVIDDLARRLAAAVPESLAAIKRDLEQNFRSVLQAGLAKLDLVTRTEFDVQSGVLQRTREKIEALEGRLAELEKQTRPDQKKK
jgi:BMFP domain-containing protein YqiC